VATQPAHGTVSGSGANLTYTPAADYHGADSFTYTVGDGQATSAAATVTVTVTPVNDAPTADPKSVTTPEGSPVSITLTGSDRDGDALTFGVVAQPAHGTLSGSGARVTYSPAAGYSGSDSFSYTAADGQAISQPATVTITVQQAPPPTSTNRLLVSDDPARTRNIRDLDGQTFRNGVPIYAFVGPSSSLASISRVTFWIDDPSRARPPFSLENLEGFDLARTADDGRAYPLESNLLSLGPHTVTAKVERTNGTAVVLSATITISDTRSHRLEVSMRSDRSQAIDLSGATLSGKRYIFLGPKDDAILGARTVVFSLDGKKVHDESLVNYDFLGDTAKGAAVAFDTSKLRNGNHEIVARVQLLGDGVDVVYRAVFTVKK
jgi:hypothetical protein